MQRYPILAGQRDEIDGAYQIIAASYEAGGKLLIAGNGGSAADAEHIVGELMKGSRRPAGWMRRWRNGFSRKARNWDRTLSSICRRHCRPSLWTVIRLSRRHMQTTAPR
mgnify:CR=1 FL=1